MAGLYVPLVMIPRFTSYVGAGTYTSVAMDVSEFAHFILTVWRGPLVSGTSPTFTMVFEESDDADVWSAFSGISTINTANANSVVESDLTRRWMRVKVTLAQSTSTIAITCWAIGNLERRERE